MKLILALCIFLASFLDIQAFHYNLSLKTTGLKKFSSFEGNLIAKVFGQRLETSFIFKKRPFQENKIKLSYDLELDDKIEKVILNFKDDKKRSANKFGISPIKIKNLDTSKTVVWEPSWKIFNKSTTIQYENRKTKSL